MANTDLTIDELAREAGAIVSTLRLYQNRGLLPPPVKRGRVGYYNDRHLERLRLIAALQERGFSLAGIKELLDGMAQGQTLQAVLGLGDGQRTWAREAPRELTLVELAEALPQVSFSAALLRRVIDLGLVSLTDDGTAVVVHSPSFLDIGRQLAGLGIPGDVILDQYEQLRDDTEQIAARFTELFRTHVWKPALGNAKRPTLSAERASTLGETLQQLGPLAEAIVTLALRQALQASAETFLHTEAARLGIAVPELDEPAAFT